MMPKRVVLMHNINDLALLIKTEDYWKAPVNRALVQKERANSLKFKDKAFTLIRSAKDVLLPNIFARTVHFYQESIVGGEVDEWSGIKTVKLPDYELIEKSLSSL